MMSSWRDIQRMYYTFGPIGFFGLVFGIVSWIVGGAWLSAATGWPDSFGSHCDGRACLTPDLPHSLALLRHGGVLFYLMFVWLWSTFLVPLVTLLSFTIYAVRNNIRRRRGTLEYNSYSSDPE